jgi:hypothetical protein
MSAAMPDGSAHASLAGVTRTYPAAAGQPAVAWAGRLEARRGSSSA